MSIIRGYSFGANEFVTAAKLHKLIDSASVTDLSPDEFSGEIHGLSTATPASIRDGDVLFMHETSVSLVRPTGLSLWTRPTYLVHYFGQWVTLFGGDTMETGRFFLGTDFAPADGINRGGHCYSEGVSGSGAVTLTLGLNSGNAAKAATVGALRKEDITYSAAGQIARVTTHGFGYWEGSSKTAGAPWLDVLYHAGANSIWQRSTASDVNGFNAMRLNTTADADSDTARLQPGYMLGSLCFRE